MHYVQSRKYDTKLNWKIIKSISYSNEQQQAMIKSLYFCNPFGRLLPPMADLGSTEQLVLLREIFRKAMEFTILELQFKI
jgi:hypothetical protein